MYSILEMIKAKKLTADTKAKYSVEPFHQRSQRDPQLYHSQQ